MKYVDYSRAIVNDNERKFFRFIRIVSFLLFFSAVLLFVANNVLNFAFLRDFEVKFFANFYLMFLLRDATPKYSPPSYVPIMVLSILTDVVIIASSALFAFYLIKIVSICKREAEEGLYPEVVEYRKKLLTYLQNELKIKLIAAVPSFVLLPVFLVLVVSNAFFTPENINIYLIAAVIVAICIIFFVTTIIVHKSKLSREGKTLRDLTAKESEIIDNNLGIVDKRPIKVKENDFDGGVGADRNKQKKPRYFPFTDLTEEAERLKKLFMLVSIIDLAAVVAITLTAFVLDLHFFGLTNFNKFMPVLMVVFFLSALLAVLPLANRIKAFRIKAENRFLSDEKYAQDLELMKKRSKRNFIMSIVLTSSYLLAATIFFILSFFITEAHLLLIPASIVLVGIIVDMIIYFITRK